MPGDLQNIRHKIIPHQLYGGYVHGNNDPIMPGRFQPFEKLTGILEYLAAQGHDELGFFRNGDKLRRRHIPQPFAFQPGQRLQAADLFRRQAQDGLIHQIQRAFRLVTGSGQKFLFNVILSLKLCLHLTGVKAEPEQLSGADMLPGQHGIFEQLLQIAFEVRRLHHADVPADGLERQCRLERIHNLHAKRR